MKNRTYLYILSLFLLFLYKLLELKIGKSIGAEHYMNPIVVVNAVSLFEIFSKHNFKSFLINFLAKGVFTVFILHSTLINYFSVSKYLQSSGLMFVCYWTFAIFIIFLICDVIGIFYSCVEKRIFDWIENRTGFLVIKINDELEGKN